MALPANTEGSATSLKSRTPPLKSRSKSEISVNLAMSVYVKLALLASNVSSTFCAPSETPFRAWWPKVSSVEAKNYYYIWHDLRMRRSPCGSSAFKAIFIVANRPGMAGTVPGVWALSRRCPGRGKIAIMSRNL